MKKAILTITILLFIPGLIKANGLTIWGLPEQDLTSTQNAITARIGYQYENIEAFIGSTWRPKYEVESGKIKPPQVFSIGALIHFQDLIDPNNSLPWIPALLLTIIPEQMVAQPYFGGQGSFNIDKDAGFYGAIVGVQSKTNPQAKASFVTEFAWNDYFYDLAEVPDKWKLSIGFRFMF